MRFYNKLLVFARISLTQGLFLRTMQSLLSNYLYSIINTRGKYMTSLIFDYQSVGNDLGMSAEIIKRLETEAKKEFPLDNMLMEIHVLRALKAQAKANV